MGSEMCIRDSIILAPLKFECNGEKLVWRKSVRYWAINVKACADGGHGRAKGALITLAMILFRSLQTSKQQAFLKLID